MSQSSATLSEYLLIAVVSAAVAAILGPVARELALRLGATARVRERDVHSEPVPYFGGVMLYAGAWAGCFVAEQMPLLSSRDQLGLDDTRHVLMAVGVLWFIGLVDDVLEVGAYLKLAAQAMTGLILAVWHVTFFAFPAFGFNTQLALDPTQGILLTVVLVVIGSNAVNLIDGLDGLAAGITAAGAAGIFLYAYASTTTVGFSTPNGSLILCALIIGACGGFLVHNASPARIFMGDSGSLLLGSSLVSAVILATQFIPDTGSGMCHLGSSQGSACSFGWRSLLRLSESHCSTCRLQ